MDKDFMQYVYSRCAEALMENKEYAKLERDKNSDQDEVQAKAEELCYIKGYKDALKLILNAN